MTEEVTVNDIAALLEVSRKSAIQRMARLVKKNQAIKLNMPTVGNPARCHDCQKKTKVEETRVLPENPRWTKRRRVCKHCGFTLWTIEMPAEDVVVKEEK
jgi:predicted Zn-ribbon and HTH transcriptional regulator